MKVWLPVGAVAAAILVLLVGMRWRSGLMPLAAREVGVPELYARPVVADVNGDGIEDAILVTGIDRGPASSEPDEDAWGKENGHFDAFVQAIDGKDGKVLWAVKQGRPYTSAGKDAKTPLVPRIVLLASRNRLGIARVASAGETTLTIHELASGKELKTLVFEHVTGAVCENRGAPGAPKGSFYFARAEGTSGLAVDLERGTVKSPAPSSCADLATTSVADVPVEEITNRTVWSPRYSQEIMLRKGAGPYGGRDIVVQSSGRGFLAVERTNVDGDAPAPGAGLDGGEVPSGNHDKKVHVVGLDILEGKTLFERSLASLGLTTQSVDHVEATDQGPLLVFEDNDGLALLDGERGDKKWSLALPPGDRLSTYTLSKTRVYLHVFGPESEVHGFLSKKLRSRLLEVDLASGKYVRSLPAGPLEP